MDDAPTGPIVHRRSPDGSGRTGPSDSDGRGTGPDAPPDADPEPRTGIAPEADAAPGPGAPPQTDTVPEADAVPEADTAPGPGIAPEGDWWTSGGQTGSQRTGGRRYRTGRPPPQQPRPDEQRRPEATPFPSGLGARGALGGLFGWCVACCLLANWLHLAVIAGLGFCVGSAVAAWFCRPTALLRLVTAVPAVFAVAEVLAQLATLGGGRHGLALLVGGGTLLTLAQVAPWLFAGTAVAVLIALFRGLPQCVRDLRTDLRGRAPTPRRPPPIRLGPPAEQALRAQPALRAHRARQEQQSQRPQGS